MIEAILGATLAYFVYVNINTVSVPRPSAAMNSRPQVPYAPISSLNLQTKHPVSISGTRQDLGRVGTNRVEMTDKYTGQTYISYHKNPVRLAQLYNV